MADKALFDELVNYAKAQQSQDATRPIRDVAALAAIPANSPQTGAGEAALRAGIDGATFGFGDSVKAGLNTASKMIQGQSTDFAKEEAAERARTKLAAQEHPVASALGGLAGSAATMAIPGLGAAKAATTAGKLFQAAKTGLTIGALSGAGHAEGDLKDRASSAVVPAAIGAATGGALGTVGAGLSAALNKPKAAVQIVKSLGNSPEAQNALAETFKNQGGLAGAGRWLAENGYVKVGKPIQETAAHLSRDLQSTGENIGGLLATADKVVPQVAVNGHVAMDAIQKSVQSVIKQNPGAAQEIWKAAQAPVKNFLNELVFPSQGGGQGVSLSQLQAFRTTLRNTYEKGTSEAVAKALQTVERSTQDIIKNSLKKHAPELASKLDDLNFQFSALSSAEKAAQSGVRKAENVASSISSSALGFGVPAAAAAALTGNPAYAVSGLTGAASSAALAPALVSRALPSAAALRNSAANLATPALQQGTSSAGQLGLRELFRQGNQ